jgi:alpha-glucosidase (family GH31 glycosyl hydrolase)
MNVGLAGIPLWGSDIGGFGFGGKCTPELYVRWFQFGAFSPLFRPHGDQTELREPWQFGPEVEAVCQRYLTLRYRLLPYIYTAAYEACTTGMPLMRPLVLAFPTDPQVFNLSDEYLFGGDILVAPVVNEGATERVMYLPVGNWVDFWTDTGYTGPCSLTVPAPLDTLPLFIRQGAILPLGPEMQYSWEHPLDLLTLEFYRGGDPTDRTFILYEDDGETTRHQSGAAARTPLQMTEGASNLRISIGESQGEFLGHQAERSYLLNIHRQPTTHQVICNGTAIPAVDDWQSLAQAPIGWWWDKVKGILTIKPPRTAQGLQINVS